MYSLSPLLTPTSTVLFSAERAIYVHRYIDVKTRAKEKVPLQRYMRFAKLTNRQHT